MTTAPDRPTGPDIRIEHGSPDAHELAALTAVLLACTATPPVAPVAPRPERACWDRGERAPGFGGPRSWRRAGPVLHRPGSGGRCAIDDRAT